MSDQGWKSERQKVQNLEKELAFYQSQSTRCALAALAFAMFASRDASLQSCKKVSRQPGGLLQATRLSRAFHYCFCIPSQCCAGTGLICICHSAGPSRIATRRCMRLRSSRRCLGSSSGDCWWPRPLRSRSPPSGKACKLAGQVWVGWTLMQVVGLPVAESADEQESTLRQGRHLGLSGRVGVAALAGSWTARGRGYC